MFRNYAPNKIRGVTPVDRSTQLYVTQFIYPLTIGVTMFELYCSDLCAKYGVENEPRSHIHVGNVWTLGCHNAHTRTRPLNIQYYMVNLSKFQN